MRIVGGKFKRRALAAPEGRAIRPTADRVREAAFNILAHGGYGPGEASPIEGAIVLDGFAGTGAMGIEALSRGAGHATFLDTDRAALACCRANLAALGAQDQADVLSADVLAPPLAARPAALAFLDPPYGKDLAAPALLALDAAGWIAKDALIMIELGAKESFDPPAGFAPCTARRYGAARLVLLRRA